MRMSWCTTAFVLVCAATGPALAQMPSLPTPGPEHAVFKAEEGIWDASIEMMAPGAPAMPPAKGTQIDTVGRDVPDDGTAAQEPEHRAQKYRHHRPTEFVRGSTTGRVSMSCC